jgi:hypothetical protein
METVPMTGKPNQDHPLNVFFWVRFLIASFILINILKVVQFKQFIDKSIRSSNHERVFPDKIRYFFFRHVFDKVFKITQAKSILSFHFCDSVLQLKSWPKSVIILKLSSIVMILVTQTGKFSAIGYYFKCFLPCYK